jgi:hypothetical protein
VEESLSGLMKQKEALKDKIKTRKPVNGKCNNTGIADESR